MATLTSSIDPASEAFQANAAVYDGLLKTLRERQAWSLAGGGERMVQRHRERGKIPVRERIDLLLDPLSPFLELSPLAAWGLYDNAVPGAGIVTGIGTIRGVICMIIANDATTKGGSFFAETIRKHVRAQDIASRTACRCVYLVDCGGAYLPQGDEVFPDQDHFGGSLLPAMPDVGRGHSADRDRVRRVHGRRRLHPGAVRRGRHDRGQQQRPSRRPADRQGRDPRDRRSRHAGRRRDAQHRLRRLAIISPRRDGGDRQDARHRRRAQPRAARPWRHPRRRARRCSMPPKFPASSAPT